MKKIKQVEYKVMHINDIYQIALGILEKHYKKGEWLSIPNTKECIIGKFDDKDLSVVNFLPLKELVEGVFNELGKEGYRFEGYWPLPPHGPYSAYYIFSRDVEKIMEYYDGTF